MERVFVAADFDLSYALLRAALDVIHYNILGLACSALAQVVLLMLRFEIIHYQLRLYMKYNGSGYIL